MKILKSTFFIGLSVFLSLIPGSSVRAKGAAPPPPAKLKAYSHDGSSSYSKPNWMSKINNATRLDRISMVGTHDTASFIGGDITQTQSMSITEQLKMGVRVMDIRCQHMNNVLQIYHGIQDQKRTFDQVISEVTQFLKSNPSETVLLKISADGTTAKNNTNTYENAFLSVYNKYKSYFWVGDYNSIPFLGNVRGKIVILQSFSGGEKYGYRWRNATIQDEYTIKNNWDLYNKWTKVKNFLNQTLSSRGGNGFYINFLSASGGSFPYFVVSGQSSSQTNAPLLMTGLTTPGWKSSYPDFPRVSCLGSLCSIAFLGTNQLTADYVRGKKGYFGIIMTDFPGPDLVDVIINTNF